MARRPRHYFVFPGGIIVNSFNVLCNHCYRLFPYRGIRAKCTSGACSDIRYTDGVRGRRRLDPDRERLWARKGRLLDLVRPCPYCEEPKRLVPACPNCWHELDPDVGQVEDRMIAILGARRAGKSHFLAALFHQLLREGVGGETWDLEISPEMRRSIDREFLRPLFHDLKELPATPVGSRAALHLVLTHRQDRRRVVLRFEDHSGERMADQALLADADFLRYAAGVVLLADPLAFEPPPRGKRRAWYYQEPTCLDILENYRQVLLSAPRRSEEADLPLQPEQKYLAVVVTKADLVLRRKKHDFWHPPADGTHLASGFWQSRSEASETAAAWLRQRLEDSHAFDAAAGLFADVSFFFASSFGYFHQPDTAMRKPPTPLRVHEPLFALLERFAAGADEEQARPGVRTGHRPQIVGDGDVL